MKSKNVKRPVRPGDTFIAYINDHTSQVGVVTRKDVDTVQVLVLGHFASRSSGERDVFDAPFKYPFPTYQTLGIQYIVPYTFELEIALCKSRNSEWWKSLGAPCYSNLIARHFRPNHSEELQYIDAVHHILRGGSIDDFKSFGYLYDGLFLKIWAVLFGLFPEKVVMPPQEWDEKNSNGYYMIDVSDRSKGHRRIASTRLQETEVRRQSEPIRFLKLYRLPTEPLGGGSLFIWYLFFYDTE